VAGQRLEAGAPTTWQAGDPGLTEPPLAGCSQDALAKALWQDSDSGMIVVDRHNRVLMANPTAEAFLARFDVTPGSPLLGRLASAVFLEDGRTVPPQDGLPLARAMVLSALPVTLDDGSAGALAIWHDVTDTWLSAERSKAELVRLSQLLEGVSDYAIVMLDPQGRVLTWSTGAHQLTGYAARDILGQSYAVLFTPEDREAGMPERILAEAAARGRAETDGERVRADGTRYWAQGVVSVQRDDEGRVRGYVKVTHDVTERREAQRAVAELNEELRRLNEGLEQRVAERTAQLEQQAADLAAVNAELEAFSYSVSHDLRAPLRAMSGFARIIEQDYGEQLPADAHRYLHKVHENATQMGNLIDALLSFSRMQRMTMSTELLDMKALATGCWTALAPARAGRDIEFVIGDLPPAAGDRRLIQQVWMNLLDNAVKYTAKQSAPRVEVTGSTSDGLVSYAVQDNGAGFDMRYAGKLGQVFQRLHRSEDFTGTGIGLALVQRIVQRHGGTMSAEGEPGAGARFGFTLRQPA
jgi:PAS domain S-box-containing protein